MDDILGGLDLASVGFVMLVTFGSVSAVNLLWKRLPPKINFILSVVLAFALGFVPEDLGSIIANHIKDALAVAFAANGAYQGLSKIAEKV